MLCASFLHRFTRPLGGLLLSLALALPASAQDPAATAPVAPTAPQAPGAGSGVIVEQDVSGHYFEWILTAIGAGAALYVVCRSSRRN